MAEGGREAECGSEEGGITNYRAWRGRGLLCVLPHLLLLLLPFASSICSSYMSVCACVCVCACRHVTSRHRLHFTRNF